MKGEDRAHVVLESVAAAGTSLALITAAGTITTALLGEAFDLLTIAYYAGAVANVVFGALIAGGGLGLLCEWIVGRSTFGKRNERARQLAFFFPALVVSAGWLTWVIVGGVFAGPSTSQFTNALLAFFGISLLAVLIYEMRDGVAKRREAESESTMKRIDTEAVASALAQQEAARTGIQDVSSQAD